MRVSAGVNIYWYTDVDPFSEGGFITKFSGFQLLVIAWLSYKIFQARRVKRKLSFWRDSSAVWLIVALAFLFLTVDDLFMHYAEVLLQINSDPVGILLRSKFIGDIFTFRFINEHVEWDHDKEKDKPKNKERKGFPVSSQFIAKNKKYPYTCQSV